MPRPPLKRRRSNKQSPSSSKRAPQNVGLHETPRLKLQQQLANKAIGQRPQDSDDSDRLVTRTRHGRHQRNAEQIFASGGVAKGDQPGVFPNKQERRTRLRSETNEVIRRSRSKSVEAAKERLSKSRSQSTGGNKNDNERTPAPVIDSSQPKSPQAQPTSMAETSVLGTLKPRRRQASILHIIDNNDESTINPEDEEQFLPDNESTPLYTRDASKSDSLAQSPSRTTASVSRKRKLGQDEISSTATTHVSATPSIQPRAASSNSMSLPSQSPRQSSPHYDDDDVMAPPQSSSPESSPQKPKDAAPPKPSKSALVPTTEQLQSLMPSKRRKGARERTQRTEFDIPSDSSSMDADEVEDESVFLPRRRGAKSRSTGKKETDSSKTKNKSVNKARAIKVATDVAATPAGKSKQTSKSTSTPLHTVVTPRTPLPLTRNTNQENKTMSRTRRQTQNQNSKPNGGKANTTITVKVDSVKQSGGSRPRRGAESGITTGAESDKENSTGRQTRSSRKRTSAARNNANDQMQADVQPTIENVDEEMEVEPEIDVGRGSTEDDDAPVTPGARAMKEHGGSTDVKAWKDKWAGIDDWNLDYEEVSISTGSSSPLRVSVV